jgi:glycosyltransferase involved in cell wall biosynthesis
MWRDAGAGGEAFDAVHASAFPYAFPIVCARRLARRLRVPFFITPFLHLGDPDDPNDRTRRGYTSPALAWLLKEADGIFVQTPSERDAALRLGLSPDKVILQGLGVDPTECTGGDRFTARQRWGLPPDAFVVGHLANLSAEKGTNDLIAATEPLWRQGRPICLLLAGPTMPNFKYSLASARALNCLGPLTDADKRDFFAAIDAFALPSRSDSFGLVLLEAWANGVPNIGYRAGGIADVIRHEIDGLLVPCGGIRGLSHALTRLHDDVDLRIRLGVDGKARLPIDFRWDDKLALVRRTVTRCVTGDPSKTAEFPVHATADVVD